MKRILFCLLSALIPICLSSQNLYELAFEADYDAEKMLFPENPNGEIIFADTIGCDVSKDEIVKNIDEWLYMLKNERCAVYNVFKGDGKLMVSIQIPVGLQLVTVPYASFTRSASKVEFNVTVVYRDNRIRYEYGGFYTQRRIIRGTNSAGQPNVLHSQRIDSLKQKRQLYVGSKKKKHIEQVSRYDEIIANEESLYQGEYDAVLSCIENMVACLTKKQNADW